MDPVKYKEISLKLYNYISNINNIVCDEKDRVNGLCQQRVTNITILLTYVNTVPDFMRNNSPFRSVVLDKLKEFKPVANGDFLELVNNTEIFLMNINMYDANNDNMECD